MIVKVIDRDRTDQRQKGAVSGSFLGSLYRSAATEALTTATQAQYKPCQGGLCKRVALEGPVVLRTALKSSTMKWEAEPSPAEMRLLMTQSSVFSRHAQISPDGKQSRILFYDCREKRELVP